MIIFEIFHCNMYWFRLSFLWLICFHRIFGFLFSFQLFKIILGLQHKIVALAPGRKIPALVYSLVFRLFASRAYRLESWVDHNTLVESFYSVNYVLLGSYYMYGTYKCYRPGLLRSYGTYIWKLREKFQIFDFSCNKK